MFKTIYNRFSLKCYLVSLYAFSDNDWSLGTAASESYVNL
jgi:hypothetical protein